MATRVRWGLSVLITLTLAAAFPRGALAQKQVEGFSDEAVEQAIEKAKTFLWSQYRDPPGNWEAEPAPGQPRGDNYGGPSALVAYALLASGESYQTPRMKKALDWQSRVETQGTYTLGLRCQIWAMLPKELGRELLMKDVKRLVDSVCQPPKGRGATDLATQARYGSYTYTCTGKPGPGGDNSNTQYGILGVWAGARSNVEIPRDYWDLVFRHFVVSQNGDGGWGYPPFGGGSTGTMTAAGLASMFVAVDNLYMEQFTKVGANPDVPTINKAMKWFDEQYAGLPQGGYFLYGVERVGVASGYKYFGKQDWYRIGASRLIRSQQGNGSWGDAINTSFCLLFLVRGRAPVLFNRLEYDGAWNNRPRAVANLTAWISQTFERDVNWQIINLKVDVEEWHDAPILVITGHEKPNFTPQDLDKLRTFVWEGGTLLSVGEGDLPAFDSAMRQYYRQLFPDYELKMLPMEHPIYTAHFPLNKPMKLWGISNGVRILALHCTEDLPLPWQTNRYNTQADAFKIAANIAFFATDRASLRFRGTTVWPEEEAFTPLRLAKVARIKHNGNWNPEPLAWERFRRIAGNKWQMKVQVADGVPATEVKPDEYRVAALTGTGALTLSESEKQALRSYVESGGTLIIDAAGGSDAFADSAQKLLEGLFGSESLRRLPAFDPLYKQDGMAIESVKYRRAAKDRIGASRAPRILGIQVNDRQGVLLSKEDLTAGLVGYPCYTCIGYDPDSAAELMRNMVCYGMRAGRPASQPAVAGR